MRWPGLVLAAAAAGLAAGLPAAAQAAPGVRITVMRVVQPDGVTPARPPYLRGRRYFYRVEYRLDATEPVRVQRSAAVLSPFGDLVARVRPRGGLEDPGAYFASAPIGVGRDDPPGTYSVRYTIRARDTDGLTVRRRVLSLRYR
ncbi:MAG: hypothetical protein MUE51_10870 [Thermoleophilia bacterium]|jgi:hypothetical protein|nr:hypothetical protein [Thermoleophilia bacterium]